MGLVGGWLWLADFSGKSRFSVFCMGSVDTFYSFKAYYGFGGCFIETKLIMKNYMICFNSFERTEHDYSELAYILL